MGADWLEQVGHGADWFEQVVEVCGVVALWLSRRLSPEGLWI